MPLPARRRNKVKGVQFTIMVVGKECLSIYIAFTKLLLGASGTGRTTFVNTLCESDVLSHKVCDEPEQAHVEDGIKIKPVNVGKSYDYSELLHQAHRINRIGGGWHSYRVDRR